MPPAPIARQARPVSPVRPRSRTRPGAGRLEPAEREKTVGVGLAQLGAGAGARQGEQGRPRLSRLEGLQDQLGEPVPNGKR